MKKTSRKPVKVIIISMILTICCAITSFAASAEYFFPRAEDDIRFVAPNSSAYDAYKRCVCNYAKDEPNYLNAQVCRILTGKVVTQTGRIKSNKAQTVYSKWAHNYYYSGSGFFIPTVKAKGFFGTP